MYTDSAWPKEVYRRVQELTLDGADCPARRASRDDPKGPCALGGVSIVGAFAPRHIAPTIRKATV